MSIPGLGQIPSQPVSSLSTRTIALQPAHEYRFQIASSSTLSLKLLSGTGEKDGIELAPRNAYSFSGVQSKILTWHGCELEVEGACEHDEIKPFADPSLNPATQLLNLHSKLSELRAVAARARKEGPRVLVVGERGSGKTTAVRTLASYATRQGLQPMVVNADTRNGMLSFPGTLSAGVFATVMDPEAVDGWGDTPTSGPSPVPVKLPLTFYFGRERPEEEASFYKTLVGKLAETTSARLSEDEQVKQCGIIVDNFGLEAGDDTGLELLSHVVDELSVNIIVVLGSPPIAEDLTKRFAKETTSLGEPFSILSLDKSDGVVQSNEQYLQQWRENIIKEYFFGDARRSLSPQIQQVDFDSLVIFKIPGPEEDEDSSPVYRESPSSAMQYWTMAVMHASVKDAPETVRTASVTGFVYVSEVDEERRKMKILAPVTGRLGDRPLVWGRWPDPFVSLLG